MKIKYIFFAAVLVYLWYRYRRAIPAAAESGAAATTTGAAAPLLNWLGLTFPDADTTTAATEPDKPTKPPIMPPERFDDQKPADGIRPTDLGTGTLGTSKFSVTGIKTPFV